jgi:hypothetical protein
MAMFVGRLWSRLGTSRNKVYTMSVIMASLTSIAGFFRGFLATSIPQIIDLLKDNDKDVCSESVDVLLNLSKQGKTYLLHHGTADKHCSRVPRVHWDLHPSDC